jgi:hypothetical protein
VTVQAEAQDGGGLNNANFGTLVDGIEPTMQMFLWGASPLVNFFDVIELAQLTSRIISVRTLSV